MNLLRAWLAGLPAYLWSGWGAIASLFLLLAAWEAVSLVYGPLVMPDPRAAFATLWGLIDSGAAWPELASERGTAIHLYGKAEARPGRKMAHVNRVLGLLG